MRNNQVYKSFLYLAFLSLIFTDKAYAYIDPGTGSYLFQILTASLLTVIFGFKNFKKYISFLIKKLLSKKSTP